MTALPHAGCGESERFDGVTTLCNMVAERDLFPAMKMNTTENPQVRNQFSMTMKTLRCCCTVNSTNCIQADCLPGAKKHLSQQTSNASQINRRKLDYQITASHRRLFWSYCGFHRLPCQWNISKRASCHPGSHVLSKK